MEDSEDVALVPFFLLSPSSSFFFHPTNYSLKLILLEKEERWTLEFKSR